LAVDFRSRRFAFRKARGEPPHRFALAVVSPVELIPQESSRLPLQSTQMLKFLPQNKKNKRGDSQVDFIRPFE
jgi:hypothetical protein